MSRERELLERAHHFIWNKDGYDNELAEEIRAYLAEPEQDEPVAWRIRRTETSAWHYTDIVECYQHVKDDGWSFEPLYTYLTAGKPFERLTEKEVITLLQRQLTDYELICAVENQLVAKNT